MAAREDERLYIGTREVETTLPVMNWFVSVATVPLVQNDEPPAHQSLVMLSLMVHFIHNPTILGLVSQMTQTQRGYPVPFAITMAGYQTSSVSFSSTPYMASIEAEAVLRRLERELHILSVSYRPPRRKKVWDWLRENHYG